MGRGVARLTVKGSRVVVKQGITAPGCFALRNESTGDFLITRAQGISGIREGLCHTERDAR
jgi:hypothetical protein